MTLRYAILFALVAFSVGAGVATFSETREYLPALMSGAFVTVQITLGGAVVAVIVAVLSGIGKQYGPAPVRWLSITYIEVFRGTSALVQLFWLFFVLPHFGITLSPMVVAIIGLGLNYGAYGAEIVRSTLANIPRGQWEACVALNMDFRQTMWRVVLPQAAIAMIPPWGNLFLELMKATSLVSLITISDLAFKAQQLNQLTLDTLRIFALVLLIYLIISLIITLAMRGVEDKFAQKLNRRG